MILRRMESLLTGECLFSVYREETGLEGDRTILVGFIQQEVVYRDVWFIRIGKVFEQEGQLRTVFTIDDHDVAEYHRGLTWYGACNEMFARCEVIDMLSYTTSKVARDYLSEWK
jgi:hypothetical protein